MDDEPPSSGDQEDENPSASKAPDRCQRSILLITLDLLPGSKKSPSQSLPDGVADDEKNNDDNYVLDFRHDGLIVLGL